MNYGGVPIIITPTIVTNDLRRYVDNQRKRHRNVYKNSGFVSVNVYK